MNTQRKINFKPVLEGGFISVNYELNLKTSLFGVSEVLMSKGMSSEKPDRRNCEIAK
jgi:hypothetical protein